MVLLSYHTISERSKDYANFLFLLNLALVSAIAACSPAVTTLLARIFDKEKLEMIQYIAIGLLIFGIAGLTYVSV